MQVIPLGPAGARRYFAPAAETSVRQDGWLMVQVGESGIAQFAGKDLEDDATRMDLVLTVLRSGKREHILAGLLAEQGVPWTPERAEQNAEWFASLTDPESKAALEAQFLPALAGFFLTAAPASRRSRSASTGTVAPAARPRTRAARSTAPAGPAPADSGASAPGS